MILERGRCLKGGMPMLKAAKPPSLNDLDRNVYAYAYLQAVSILSRTAGTPMQAKAHGCLTVEAPFCQPTHGCVAHVSRTHEVRIELAMGGHGFCFRSACHAVGGCHPLQSVRAD